MQHYKHNNVGITPEQKNKLSSISRNVDSLTGWKHVDCFGSYGIFSKGELRRLVDMTTGKITIEYSAHQETCNVRDYL